MATDWIEGRPCVTCNGWHTGDFGQCEECQRRGKGCRHGNNPADCDECDIESDRAYDEGRERQ